VGFSFSSSLCTKVRKEKEKKTPLVMAEDGREVGSSREISSTIVSKREEFLRNGFTWCPLTLKLLPVDSLLISTVP